MSNIMDVKNEDALDLLADLMEPACVILADPEVQKHFDSGSPVVRVVATAIRNNKSAVIEILAALKGVKPEEYECTVPSLLADVMRLVNDPVMRSLFQSQGQNSDLASSGSATENIEADEA